MPEKLSSPNSSQIFILEAGNPNIDQITTQLTSLANKLNLKGFDPEESTVEAGNNPNASRAGFLVPDMYGDMPSRIKDSLKKRSKTRLFIAANQKQEVTGFCEIEMFPKGEEITSPDFRFPISNRAPTLQSLLQKPHAEIREIAVDPNVSPSPVFSLLSEATKFSRDHHMAGLTAWVIGHKGPNIPNKTSWHLLTGRGFIPAVTTTSESAVEGTVAAGLYKIL